MHKTSEIPLELLNLEVQKYDFSFLKFPVDCDAMTHVLKELENYLN